MLTEIGACNISMVEHLLDDYEFLFTLPKSNIYGGVRLYLSKDVTNVNILNSTCICNSYTLNREYRVVRYRYSRLIFTSEDRLCAKLRVQKTDRLTLFHRYGPCVLPCPQLRNTKVPVWTHEYMGYPTMDISHWDAAIDYCIQLAQYCDHTRSYNATLQRSPPCVLPCPKTHGPQSACVDPWVHGVPEIKHQLLDEAIHYGIQLAQYCYKTRTLTRFHRDHPPVYSLSLRLRNNKVPVLTHESIGYPKMDISHWDAAIHYGIQLTQYWNRTWFCNATLQRSLLCTPLP